VEIASDLGVQAAGRGSRNQTSDMARPYLSQFWITDLHDLPTRANRCIICCDKQKGLRPIGVHLSTAVILSVAKDLSLAHADPSLRSG
jgi:hypothetical protein